jgi:glycosyltransferase involved in cell wall biosynthesis
MRIGVVWDGQVSGGVYRAVQPCRAMEALGHEVVWPRSTDGTPEAGRLTSCDVVHIHRRADERTIELAADLARLGIGITWDNDDDFTAAPREHPHYHVVGGRRGKALFEQTVRIAKLAHGVSVPSEALRQRYLEAGVPAVEVIPNHLAPDRLRRPRRHDGIVIGWVAGLEHRADAARIPIADALAQVLERHRDVRVECIGVDLELPVRYRHDGFVRFDELPTRLAGWDIGLAPLADIPFNRARSDIKLKEYAGSGIAWLASPVGPYAGHGEHEGGWLVADDEWADRLDRLVSSPRKRRRLVKLGRRWASEQTIDRAAAQWERRFRRAAETARARRHLSAQEAS